MIRLSPVFVLVVVAPTLFPQPSKAAQPAEILFQDIPSWGDWGEEYKIEPFLATAIKFQALGEEKAKKLLSELAESENRYARYEARLKAMGLMGNRLEDALKQEEAKEFRRDKGLIVLCRMLFVAKLKKRYRGPSLGSFYVGNHDWPLGPIEIVDGVPFSIASGGGIGGLPESAKSYVRYCIKNCDWNTVKYQVKTYAEMQNAMKKLLAHPAVKKKDGDWELFFTSQIERADILIADFEGDTYGEGWKVTGTAFGKGPAKGTLPGQMPVSGYLGKGLVNTYLGGDAATGTLTSPEFKVERKYINFLVGGGKHKGTHIDLLVGGKVVRTATGPNDKPGGSEHLDWHTWDVSEFESKAATIVIIDEEKGGWGHINVDHIVQSDTKKQAEVTSRLFAAVDKRYLLLPVKNGAPKRRVTINTRLKMPVGERTVFEDEVVREFDIELAEGEPDFWVFADVSAFKGKTLAVKTALPGGSKALDALKLSDEVPNADKLYQEKHRPLFHFTSRVGWLNDPNGLVYANGEWHLFYQHNPFGREWGNMHWGHATSKDLFRWKEEGIALYPKKYGDWAFSGSAVLDKENTSGFGTKEKPPLVLAYTSTGRGECIAYSDTGKRWREYDHFAVVKHAGRDPKLVWHAKAKHWVMAVYDEFQGKQWIAFYTSPDLKKWTFASRIEGFYECPDLFPTPAPNGLLTGGPPKEKWVLYAADGKYLLGEFDGKTFTPDFKEKKQLWYGNFYAAQTFDNAPKSEWTGSIGPPLPPAHPRRVQIGWAQGVTFPGTPFNQQMTVPVDLALAGDKDGSWLVASPAPELATLRDGKPLIAINTPTSAKAREAKLLADKLDAFELDFTVNVSKSTGFTLDLRGTKLIYDAAKGTLTCKGVTAPVKTTDDLLDLKVLVDRGSVEVFAGYGRVAMSIAVIPDEKNDKLELLPSGGDLIIRVARVWRMKSAWEK